MIEAKQLTKNFGAVRAVKGVSFAVERGEAVGFLGPNGAGKTTTFRMLAGTLAPDMGTVRIMGHDLFSDPIVAKSHLGYMAENAPLYPELSARQYLQFRAELRGIKRSHRRDAVNRAAEKTGMAEMLEVPIGHLSKGYRQRTAFADAILGDPPVLLLDEPTSGLDPNQVLLTRELIRSLAKEHAVILSTHVLSEVEATCQRALVIDRGRLVAQGSLEELRAGRTQQKASVRVLGDAQFISQVTRRFDFDFELKTNPLVESEFELVFELAENEQIARVVQRLVEAGLQVIHAAAISAPLDEIFAQLTREEE